MPLSSSVPGRQNVHFMFISSFSDLYVLKSAMSVFSCRVDYNTILHENKTGLNDEVMALNSQKKNPVLN